jgi:hypothetical protein
LPGAQVSTLNLGFAASIGTDRTVKRRDNSIFFTVIILQIRYLMQRYNYPANDTTQNNFLYSKTNHIYAKDLKL